MLDYDPAQEEINRQMWKKYWEEHPNDDPVKVMCAIVCMTWIIGILALFVFLILAAIYCIVTGAF